MSETTYTFRKITKTQAQIMMRVDNENVWTVVAEGPAEAVQRRFDALMAAKKVA